MFTAALLRPANHSTTVCLLLRVPLTHVLNERHERSNNNDTNNHGHQYSTQLHILVPFQQMFTFSVLGPLPRLATPEHESAGNSSCGENNDNPHSWIEIHSILLRFVTWWLYPSVLYGSPTVFSVFTRVILQVLGGHEADYSYISRATVPTTVGRKVLVRGEEKPPFEESKDEHYKTPCDYSGSGAITPIRRA